ncbi:MAG TPA: hypothetical protein VNO31_23345, partial [Umezawaea sp.]|nr:hypothetical protein [Umezawaea sp.]
AGRTGVALGVTTEHFRNDIIIDPATGRFIGNRMVLAEPGTDYYEGLPAGTAIEFSAFTSATVPAEGVEP